MFENVGVSNNSQKRTIKASYTLDPKTVQDFNELAKIKHYNKSQTVNNLLRLFIEEELKLLKA